MKHKKINISEVQGNSNSIFPEGTVFVNSSNELKISDGVTQGGLPFPFDQFLNSDDNATFVDLTFGDGSTQTTAAQNIVNDALNTSLIAGSGIDLTYDNIAETLSISTSGVPLSTISGIDITGLDNNEFLVYNSGTNNLEPSNGLTYSEEGANRLIIDCDCPEGNAGVILIGDQKSPLLRLSTYSEDLVNELDDSVVRHVSRTIYFNARGTQAAPSGCQVDDPMFIIRGDAYNPHETLNVFGNRDDRTLRIMGIVSASGTDYLGSDLVINTSTGGPTVYDNSFRFTHDGKLVVNNIDITSGAEANIETMEPDGFVNRTDSEISFDNNTAIFSIGPKSPSTQYVIYNNGTRIVKGSVETLTLPNPSSVTALYYIHFDKSNDSLSYKTTGFDFSTDIPIAHIYWNHTTQQAVYFGEERHGISMDTATHTYLHNVMGTQYVNGLSISNYTLSGDGSSDSDATIAIGDGLIYDEDIQVNITHSNSPSNPFEQILSPIAQIPVYYKDGSGGAWTNTTANDYPIKTNTTIQYNLDNAGTWSADDSPNPTNSRFIAYWICATSQENAPIISIMGQRIDSSLIQATSNNSWSNLDLTGLPIVELRPLYRIIYDTNSNFTNNPKGYLVDILDIRGHVDVVAGVVQNDHGNLYGLADDDHYQYVHIDNARTISATHSFTNGLNAGNLSINNANTISSTDTNGNIILQPNGSGDVQINADTLRVGDNNADATIITNGTGNLKLSGDSGSANIIIETNGNVNINPGGSGATHIGSSSLLMNSGTSIISTSNNTSDLILATNKDTTSANIRIGSGVGGGIVVNASGNFDFNSGGNIFLSPETNYGNVYINNTPSGGQGIVVKTAPPTGASPILNIVQLSQATYDALGSYDANTLYVIT